MTQTFKEELCKMSRVFESRVEHNSTLLPPVTIMFRWALLYLCFIAHYYVCCGQDMVEQPSEEMTESEGAQVILMCNYSSTNPDLFWYKQLPNRSPTFILNQYTTEPDFKRFSATPDSTSRMFPLTIKNLRVSDSAVYYCALRPTVTETHSTLTQKQRKCSILC
uniref:Ig-like domain-containing protein n=1 Tax=Cyprinus carpio carpio TaxID=630221 RepID=A0A9J7Z193_CYPCA